MALSIGAILLWLAAISRVIASIKRPDGARISMTVATICIAIAFTLAAVGSAFDDLLNWPNGAELIQHLFFAVATFATLRFMLLLRLGSMPRRVVMLQAMVCVTVCLTMTALFAAIPLADHSAENFAAEYAGNLAAVAYRSIFYAYLVYCLIGIAVLCRRNAITAAIHGRSGSDPESVATAISLSAIGISAVTATVAAVAGLASMTVRYTGHNPTWLGTINTVAVAGAAILAAAGVLSTNPVEAFLRWRRAHRTCTHLAELWAGLTSVVPDVVLPMPTTRSPVSQAELASTRRRIEIADALHRIRINGSDAAAIRRSSDPSAALGRTLRDPSTWAATGAGGVIAAELLHTEPDSELQQIWTVAAAYGRAS